MDPIDVSTAVGWPVYVVLGLFFGWLVWVVVAPDYWWRVERSLVGWQYRDGHRIELSTAGRVAARFGAVVGLVTLCVIAGLTVHWSAESRVDVEWESPNTIYHVGDPVESPGCVALVFVCLRSDVVFPVSVTGYLARPRSDNLTLYVESRFFPTQVVLDEGERVTVTVYGKCAARDSGDAYGRSTSDCATDTPIPPFDRVEVPVTLAEPLGGRIVVDGDRGVPVEPPS